MLSPRLFIFIAVLGLFLFLSITALAPFKDWALSALYPKPASQAAAFLEDFAGQRPTTPQPWNPRNWDITYDTNEDIRGDYLTNPMEAPHGPSCQPTGTHHLSGNYADYVYICDEHVMTALNSGDGLIFLTPNQMVDFSQGEAVIRFDMSTYRTSPRDFMEVIISPFAENVQLGSTGFLGGAMAANNIIVKSGESNTNFNVSLMRNRVQSSLSAQQITPLENFITTSSTKLSRFEIRVTRTHIKMGMVNIDPNDPKNTSHITEFWWVDQNVADLGWDKGVIQWNHSDHNPSKICTDAPWSSLPDCGPQTWHFDNFSISPALPFSIIRANKRVVSDPTSGVTLDLPTPANAFLRFIGIGSALQYRYSSNGTTWSNWLAATLQNYYSGDGGAGGPLPEERFKPYWLSIPAGTTQIQFQGTNPWFGPWGVKDISVWSQVAGTSTPAPTIVGTPTPMPSTTVAPTSVPTSVPTSAPTAAPGSVTVTFDDRAGQDQALTGQYPTGVLDWGTGNTWLHSSPYQLFTTKSVSFINASTTSGVVTVLGGRRLVSVDAYNGGTVASTVTLGCAGQTTRTFTVPVGQIQNLTTNWTGGCGATTMTSSNGWNTNFDNLVLSSTTSTPAPTVPPTAAPTVALLQGDADGNGTVNIFDYNIVMRDYGQTSAGLLGDLDRNGTVNIFDYNIVLRDYGKTS